MQGALTVAKVAGSRRFRFWRLALHPVTPELSPLLPPVARPVAAFGVAMIAVMWAFEGWSYLAMSSGEIRDAARIVPRA